MKALNELKNTDARERVDDVIIAIKILKQYANEYVTCLPVSYEKEIMNTVTNAVHELHLSEEEKAVAIKNANNEKVCNLTDTIEIEFI